MAACLFQFLQFLLSPFIQTLVDFRNFKHLPPRNWVNNFIANLTGAFGKILPMSRIVEEFLLISRRFGLLGNLGQAHRGCLITVAL
jgi:hypothetical protein